MQVILLIGIQASGKSTFFKERFADTHVHISLDMLNTRHREATLFQKCLELDQPVVIDNTNATREIRERFVEPALSAGAKLIGYYFHSAASQSLDRNATRSGIARVPDKAIIGTAAKLEFPALAEGFDELYYVRIYRGERFLREAVEPKPTTTMKLETLESKLRAYETTNDRYILPGMWAIVRVDGRNFTRLTKEKMQYEAPYDIRFRDVMITAASRLMDVGTKATLAYTQSDEISLLLDLESIGFARKERKLISILAGEASAALTLAIGQIAVMDARLIQFPSFDLVREYFRWRQEDALRNALNSHCYWKLRNEGLSPKDADAKLAGTSVAQKNELLFRYGINFNDLPNWQKRGTLVYWEEYEKFGFNPIVRESTIATRRQLKVDLEIPTRDQLAPFIESLLPDKREAK